MDLLTDHLVTFSNNWVNFFFFFLQWATSFLVNCASFSRFKIMSSTKGFVYHKKSWQCKINFPSHHGDEMSSVKNIPFYFPQYTKSDISDSTRVHLLLGSRICVHFVGGKTPCRSVCIQLGTFLFPRCHV